MAEKSAMTAWQITFSAILYIKFLKYFVKPKLEKLSFLLRAEHYCKYIKKHQNCQAELLHHLFYIIFTVSKDCFNRRMK